VPTKDSIVAKLGLSRRFENLMSISALGANLLRRLSQAAPANSTRNPYDTAEAIVGGMRSGTWSGLVSRRQQARDFIDRQSGAPLAALVKGLIEVGPPAKSVLRYAESKHPQGWIGDDIRKAIATISNPVELASFRASAELDRQIGNTYSAAPAAVDGLARGDKDAYAVVHRILTHGGAPTANILGLLHSPRLAGCEAAQELIGYAEALHAGAWYVRPEDCARLAFSR
jgi:hypothetical protein